MAAILVDEPAQQEESQRPKKRQKLEQAVTHEQQVQSSSQNLFAPFRALGIITNHIPFVLQTRSYKGASEGPRIHILTCLGRSWALWDGGKMTLLFVGTEAEAAIDAMAMDGDFIWAAAGSTVVQYHRGKEVKRVVNPLGKQLSSILIFGSHLLSLTNDGKRLLGWSTETAELVSSLEFAPNFTATTIVHPATYINKVLIGSAQGTMQIWNISTKSRIYDFPYERLGKSTASAITCLVQSPPIDVIAIGFASGEIVIHDVKMDERLLRMFQEGGPVKALAFRGDGEGVLASCSTSGHITLWNLTERGHLLHIIRGAHDAAVTGVEWIPGQPVLVSSGEDNSVKQWCFESPTVPPYLLKFRSGHFSPPHLVRYYGSDGKALLTASRDRSLRYLSVFRDTRSTELSQGHLAKKATSLSMPIASFKFSPITSLSFSTTRSKDWDDVLSAHTDESFARTWSVQNKKHGKHKLPVHASSGKKKAMLEGSVNAVHVTACGNFGLAANSRGVIGMWNMQSGIRRRTFLLPTPDHLKDTANRNTGRAVTGLATDSLNRVVIVATVDGTINFFDFHTSNLQTSLNCPTTIASILFHRDSGLLSVACDDHKIRMYDVETRRLVREFSGLSGRIIDFDISSDARWLIVASMDSIIRTFDIPTGRLIDAFKPNSVTTSLAFSPAGDFLATAHVDSVGIYLWANRSQFADVSLRGLVTSDVDLVPVQLPSVEGDVDETLPIDLASLSMNEPQDVFVSPNQLESELVTLTLLPRDRWQTLMNLDIIQEKNKPKEPPKAPEKAPFFLPTLPGVEQRFDLSKQVESTNGNAEKTKNEKKTKKAIISTQSKFHVKLKSEPRNGTYDDLFDFIKMLSPSAVELELRSLILLEDLSSFMHALERRLQTHRDFEAVQSLVAVFIKLHGDELIQNAELKDACVSLIAAQKRESRRILELLTSSLGVLNFVRELD